MSAESRLQREAKSWPQVLAILTGKCDSASPERTLRSICISASIAANNFGMLFTWPSPAIPVLISEDGDFRFTLEQCSYLPVISAATSMLATPIFGKLLDTIGRKLTILTMVVSQSAAFLLAAFAQSIYVFYLSRFFSGLSDACVYVGVPTYVGEVSTPKVRGQWGNAVCLFSYVGQVIISVIAEYNSIRTGALISLFFPLLFAVTFSFMPESPYYLLMKGQKEAAYRVLQKLLRLKDVDVEIKQFEADVNRQMSETGTWKDLFAINSNRRALYAGSFLRTAQQFSGITVWGVYTEYIFKQAGGNMSASGSAIIFLSACAVGSFFATLFFSRIGARRAVKFSSFSSALVLAVVGIFFYISLECPQIDVSSFKWLPLVGMLLYVALFSIGLGIAPTFMLSELFSASIKGKGLCALNVFYGFLQCATTKLFQLLEVNFGMYTPFALFAVISFGSAFLVDRFVPDTSGKSLEEIQQDLKGNKKT